MQHYHKRFSSPSKLGLMLITRDISSCIPRFVDFALKNSLCETNASFATVKYQEQSRRLIGKEVNLFLSLFLCLFIYL